MSKEKFIFGHAAAVDPEQYARHLRKQRGTSYPVSSERGIESVWIYEMEKPLQLEKKLSAAADMVAQEINKLWSKRPTGENREQALLAIHSLIADMSKEVEFRQLIRVLRSKLNVRQMLELSDLPPVIVRSSAGITSFSIWQELTAIF